MVYARFASFTRTYCHEILCHELCHQFPYQKSSCVVGEREYLGNVDWQQVISLGIVGAAAAGLGWSKFRPRKARLGCDSHCGCSSPAHSTLQSTMVFRARRGERPQIIVKMK